MPENQPTRIAPSHSIAPLNKGLGAFHQPLTADDVAHLDWNLLREDLSLPTAVLYDEKIRHNLAWMRQFITAYGVKLAPHGKTTMAPRLFAMQLEAGAWGITLATAQQVQVACTHGVRRILMANQLVGKQNMQIVAGLLRDPAFEFYTLVDSVEQIDQLGAFFSPLGLHLNVLLELGIDGGRAGIRTDEQLQSVLEALARWPNTTALCGVELYEGILHDESLVRAFLSRAVQTTQQLISNHRFHRDPVLLSGAGSAWYDVVAEVFSAAKFNAPVEIILRPGCYLTHDVGNYRDAQSRILAHNPVAHRMQSGLVPALHLWAYVQSIPEPTRAIIGLGRRDASFDSGLPVPALHYRPSALAPQAAPSHWMVAKLMDQHAYLDIQPNDNIHVGDMIAFDICHPCLTFDKWRTLPIVNASYQVVDIIQTYF